MLELRQKIQNGLLFPVANLKMETISSTASMPKEAAQKEAVKIAKQKKHVAVCFQYSDNMKSNCLLKMINKKHFGIKRSELKYNSSRLKHKRKAWIKRSEHYRNNYA